MVYFSNLSFTKKESDDRYAKLESANVFEGQNTFNQRITSYKGFQTSNVNADIIAMNAINEKASRIIYKQTGTGFKNWCNMKYLWTNNDSTYTNLLTFTFKPDNSNDNNIVEFTTELGSFSFNNKEIKGVSNPTTNNSVANKQYVDNRVKLIEKTGFNFTRQELNTTSGNEITKYFASMNYTTIGITNTSQIISCYLKSIPSRGQHLVVTFFGEYNTDTLLVEIYQYNNRNDITNDLNTATFIIGYINS